MYYVKLTEFSIFALYELYFILDLSLSSVTKTSLIVREKFKLRISVKKEQKATDN